MEQLFKSTSKITSADIKSILRCHCGNCNHKEFKRVKKLNTKSVVDYDGNLIPETTIPVRVFTCLKCDMPLNIHEFNNAMYADAENGIIDEYNQFYSTTSILEFTIDNTSMNWNVLALGLWLNTDKFEDYISYDDLRDENIMGICQHFLQNGIVLCNSMENIWEIDLVDTTSLYFHKIQHVKTYHDLHDYIVEIASTNLKMKQIFSDSENDFGCVDNTLFSLKIGELPDDISDFLDYVDKNLFFEIYQQEKKFNNTEQFLRELRGVYEHLRNQRNVCEETVYNTFLKSKTR